MGLFASEDQLKEGLRLSRLPANSGATELLAAATLVVRLGILEELDAPRVADIAALPFTSSPLTGDEILRATANMVEIKWVRLELSKSMPMLFADGNIDNGQIMHDEALFRQPRQDQLETLRSELWDEIMVGIDRLRQANSAAQDRNRVRFEAITPACAPPVPGDTGKPGWRIL